MANKNLSNISEENKALNAEIEKFADSIWLKNDIHNNRNYSSKEPWSIMMPPPNVTGNLHIGHALNMTLQDVLTRFWRMNNKDAYWQPGTDHAGIATQMVVERKLLEEKNISRTELGRDKFLEEVWNWKNKSGGQILEQLRRLGASANWDKERFTLDEGLSKAVKKVFIKLYNDGLIYRDKRLVNWDTKLRTAISDLEVVQKESKSSYWYLKYFLENNKTFIVVATTRPETMLGDTGVAVHPDDSRYKKFIGKNVILPLIGRKIPIVGDTYADPDKGTGAVKITPAHDFNDFDVGKRNNLDIINILNEDGTLNNNVPNEYRSLDRFEARDKIISQLEKDDYLVKVEDQTNLIPYGDRSDTIIEPFLTDQWFVDAKKLSLGAIKAVKNKETVFVPKSWENTFFDWMQNIEPWCISRQLWWGHRIPAWFSEDGKIFVAENENEANELAFNFYGKKVKLNEDPDVLDTWFSSGLWPFSTLGWPENTESLKRYYPGNVLVTGFDIIFFWVARMMMFGIYFLKKSPFKEVYVHALVRDTKGQKMSKSKGNVIDPLVLMNKYGTDALRFTLVSLATYGRDLKLAENRLIGYRNFITKILNASNFLLINNCLIEKDFSLNLKFPANKWIYHQMLETSLQVTDNIKMYKFNEVANSLYQFVWHKYCDWYLEIIKSVLIDAKNEFYIETKSVSAFVFSKILCILHPVIPFYTEYLYSKIHNFGKCLAIENWPEAKNIEIYSEDNTQIDWIINFISEVRSLRSIMNINAKNKLTIEYIDLNVNHAKFLKINTDIIKRLSNIEFINKVKEIRKLSSQILVDEATFYVPMEGIIDIDTETKRLKNELLKINDNITLIENKLKNKEFMENAPQNVVKEQIERKEIYESSKNRIKLAVDRLFDI